MTKTYCDGCKKELKYGAKDTIKDELQVSNILTVKLHNSIDLCRSCAGYIVAHGEYPAQAVREKAS